MGGKVDSLMLNETKFIHAIIKNKKHELFTGIAGISVEPLNVFALEYLMMLFLLISN